MRVSGRPGDSNAREHADNTATMLAKLIQLLADKEVLDNADVLHLLNGGWVDLSAPIPSLDEED